MRHREESNYLNSAKYWQERCADMEAALRAAKGYLINAEIDLKTGCPKATALRTIAGGIAAIDAVLP